MTTSTTAAGVSGSPPAPPSPPVQTGGAFIPLARGEREALPNRRRQQTTKVKIGGQQSLYLHCGSYPDGRLGEIFIDTARIGSFTRGVLEGFAAAISIGLQYGTPIQAYVDFYKTSEFAPNGITDDPDLAETSSILDYIFRRIEQDFPNA